MHVGRTKKKLAHMQRLVVIDAAIERAGGVTQLANKLGLVRATVSIWKRRGVSKQWLDRVSQLTGEPAERLR
jgi:hypothetical protein